MSVASLQDKSAQSRGRMGFWLALLGFISTLALLFCLDWLVAFAAEAHYRDLPTLLIAFTCLIFFLGSSAVSLGLLRTPEWRSLADSALNIRLRGVFLTALVIGVLGSALFVALNISGLNDSEINVRFGARAFALDGTAVLLLHSAAIIGISASKQWGRIAAAASFFFWILTIILLIPGAILIWLLWRGPALRQPLADASSGTSAR